jgi:N-glycosylase/DNA lyase
MDGIDLKGQPFDLDLTLGCGQAFRWRKREDGAWMGVVGDRLFELALADGCLLWRTHPMMDRAAVEDYLLLNVDVNAIYDQLSLSHDHLAEQIRRFHGLRLLRQDPNETLPSFVCSAANSIPRISAAIEKLCELFGSLVCEHNESCYYAFPTMNSIAEADERTLAAAGSLAFRGANLKSVAQQVLEMPDGWLMGLRHVPYEEARDALTQIRGVGRKIADCVCLFSLDKYEAVPVDTHIRQIAQRVLLPDMKTKSITDSAYRQICGAFRERYGDLAGWAQQVLFYEDLMRACGKENGQTSP